MCNGNDAQHLPPFWNLGGPTLLGDTEWYNAILTIQGHFWAHIGVKDWSWIYSSALRG